MKSIVRFHKLTLLTSWSIFGLFVSKADLTRYDLSGLKPVQFVIPSAMILGSDGYFTAQPTEGHEQLGYGI